MTEGHAPLDAAAYTRIYEAEYSRLCGYARTLTGNPWVAGDLVAEAHYSVWRRLRAGHPLGADAVPAELTSAVRGLSAGAGGWGPPQQASYLEPLVQVLHELPQRWVKVLWLTEVDGLPPEDVAWRTGVNPDGAAALVERVRGSVRQEFLRAQPGYPASAACGEHWERLPGHVQGTDSPHQAERIAVHIDGCRDCRGRMEQLVAADDRLPALTGPALLALYDRGMARFLAPLAAAAAVGAAGAAGVGALAAGGAHAAPSNGPLVSSRRSMRHLVRGQVRQAGPVAVAAAAGGVLLVAGAAVMTGLALTDGGSAEAQQPAGVSTPSISDTSDSSDSSGSSASSGSSSTSGTSATSGASRHSDGSRAGETGEASRNRPSTSDVPAGHSPADVPSSAVSPSRKAPSSSSSASPSSRPSSPGSPSSSASSSPSSDPSDQPTDEPTDEPTDGGTTDPEGTPSGQPTDEPTQRPTAKPTDPGSDPGSDSGSGDSRGCVSLVVRLCVSH
ncbi:hypothetical protein [Streptomyces sp. PSAA01]|uniref:hypothetical protein n=1 Tax=Streptomyces sp. PSAA01 TaxID=2912762 RepID=UPI001F4313F4|nr:hypothetical protein [Streptomyces sp. PSAA01]MCG0288445.1 hypothetical protein [Streptomyces sp. PSAA01]